MPETASFPTRRSLLTALAGASLAEFALPILRGQGVTGNRTLVCIYHLDGNDSNNMVVPLDSGRYGAYARARGELGWRPRYDFARALACVNAGEDHRSELARAIGSRGYHRGADTRC